MEQILTPNSCRDESVHKEAFPADAFMSANASIALGVKSVEEGTLHESVGPY
jgi:hypothetical protein